MSKKCWLNLHKNAGYLEKLPQHLSYYWERCYEKKIDPHTTFVTYSPKQLKKAKEQAIKIYAYTNRCLYLMMNYNNNPHLGFAVFDSDCCLLKLYGSRQFLDWCHSHNIKPGTVWTEDSIGANAVSIGIETKRPTAVVGSENYCRLLIDTAVYFYPYTLNEENSTYHTIIYGGLALIVPYEYRDPNYLMLAAAVSNDITLHLYMADELHCLYAESKGLISIDINTVTNKPHILYHSLTIFNILETNPTDLYFKDVDTLFDPLPKNKAFWEIIEQTKK